MAKSPPPPSVQAPFFLNALILEWKAKVRDLEDSTNIKALCTAWLELYELCDVIESLDKQLGAVYEKLNKEIVPRAFEKAELEKVSVPELGRSFYPLEKYSASIPEGKVPEAMKWLKENGLEALITETVNRQTLAATLKERLLKEAKDPPDSMKLEKYNIMGSSKYKPKP